MIIPSVSAASASIGMRRLTRADLASSCSTLNLMVRQSLHSAETLAVVACVTSILCPGKSAESRHSMISCSSGVNERGSIRRISWCALSVVGVIVGSDMDVRLPDWIGTIFNQLAIDSNPAPEWPPGIFNDTCVDVASNHALYRFYRNIEPFKMSRTVSKGNDPERCRACRYELVAPATVRAILRRTRRPTLRDGLLIPRGHRSAVSLSTLFILPVSYHTRGQVSHDVHDTRRERGRGR
jgi:hypothetical protein